MSVAAPRQPKPPQIGEILRVLAIYDLLVDGLADRASVPVSERPYIVTDEQAAATLLAVAQSIAARTTEG